MTYPYIRILYIEIICNPALDRCRKEAGRLLGRAVPGNKSFISNATCEGARAHSRWEP